MIVKIETSKGYVEIEIGKTRTNNISYKKIENYNIVDALRFIKGKNYINELYTGCLGHIFHKDIHHVYKFRRELYDNDNWKNLLQEEIKKGNVWISIELDDSYYGSPEYKLELI